MATKVIITADTAQAQAAMRSLGMSVDGATKQFLGLNGIAGKLGGILTVGALVAYGKSVIDLQNDLADLGAIHGLTAREMSGLKFAAEQNGASLDLVAKATKELGINLANQPEKFAKLGITAKDSVGALTQVADVVAKLPNEFQRNAVLAELFGKKVGPELTEFLSQGGDSMRAFIERGKEIYGVTKENSDKAKEFNDKLNELKANAAGFGIAATGQVLPALTKIATAMADTAREAGLLQALLVGFGATLTAVFTDDMLEREQKIAKDLKKLREEQAQLLHRRDSIPGWLNSAQGNDERINELNKQMLTLQQELLKIQQQRAEAAKKQAEAEKAAKDAATPTGVTDLLGAEEKAKREREFAQALAESNRILADVDPTAKANLEWQKLLDLQTKLGDQFPLTAEQMGQAYAKSMGSIEKENEKSTKKMSEHWRTFADNTQRTLSDVLFNGMNGEFTNIEDAFKQMLMRMAANAASARLTEALFGNNGKSGSDSNGWIGAALNALFNANGNAFTGNGVAAFANGGAFTNGIYDSPTPFKFANGGGFSLGVMGEKDAEAVMPLARDGSGRLGVRAQGGGGKQIVYQDNSVTHIDSRADRAQIMSDMNRLSDQKLAKFRESMRRGTV